MEKKINIIFDFDGVILNSNKIKTLAFKTISKEFGSEKSNHLVNYHLKNGGISRFEKISWFVKNILKIENEHLINKLIYDYGVEVKKSLFECEFRTNLTSLRKKLEGTFWSIASGGLEEEIKNFLIKKSFIHYFENGVYGSPTPKIEIVENIKLSSKSNNNIWFLIGDSIYDYECAREYEMNFILATDWSEIKNPCKFAKENNIEYISGIEELDLEFLNSKKFI